LLSCHLTSPSPVSTLSLHAALPISRCPRSGGSCQMRGRDVALLGSVGCAHAWAQQPPQLPAAAARAAAAIPTVTPRVTRCRRKRSEEHTSELQSRFDLVCRLLLEKK